MESPIYEGPSMISSSANKISILRGAPLTIKPGYILSKSMDPLVFVGLSALVLLIPFAFTTLTSPLDGYLFLS